MAEDFTRRAAHDVDANFLRTQDDLFREHRRQEQRQLAHHHGQLQGFARNRDVLEARYVQRMRQIDRGYERAAAAIGRRHNSLGGRLERLTRAGRARQEATRQALEDRRATLDRRATAQFEGRKERQFQAEQADRIARARELKLFRLEHLDHRQQQRRHHEATRDFKIDVRVQELRRAAEQSLRQQMQQVHRQQEGRSLSR